MFTKLFLNYLGNYAPNQWTKESGCVKCSSDATGLPADKGEWPKIQLALFVEQPTPFFGHVLERLQKLDYPKHLMSIWIHNRVCTVSHNTYRLFIDPLY